MTTTQISNLRAIVTSELFADIYGLCERCADAWITWSRREVLSGRNGHQAYGQCARIARLCRTAHRGVPRYRF